MATYQYHCQDHGLFDTSMPMGAAPGAMPCPACGQTAGRRYSAPLLRRTPDALRAWRDKEDKSRHKPDVVAQPPPAHRRPPGRTVDDHPLWKRLPRG